MLLHPKAIIPLGELAENEGVKVMMNSDKQWSYNQAIVREYASVYKWCERL